MAIIRSKKSLMCRAIIWLLALIMPFQVLTAVHLDVRGPLHFHVEGGHGKHHHDSGPERERGSSHDYGHYLPHFHGQHHVERHHHHPHDSSVVTVRDHGLSEPLALKAEITPGWSATMLAALLATSALLLLRATPGGLMPRPELLLQTRFPGRLERPPRTIPL